MELRPARCACGNTTLALSTPYHTHQVLELPPLTLEVTHLVEPTNNRAEQTLRCGVLWRQRSLGTASDKGNRWVERMLSLKETCRRHARATYAVLVDAVSSFFQGHQPDLSWINTGASPSPPPRSVHV